LRTVQLVVGLDVEVDADLRSYRLVHSMEGQRRLGRPSIRAAFQRPAFCHPFSGDACLY